MRTALLLIVSNVFMTFAWYGHLKHTSTALWVAILVSWIIAGVEYCFAVPANRIGYAAGYSAFQLKIMQECITIGVFILFAALYMREKLQWNHAVAFMLILGAVYFVFGIKPAS